MCTRPSYPPTASGVNPPRCPACAHKTRELCPHESGTLRPWPGTLGTERDDGRPWDWPGDGEAARPCGCASSSDDISICTSSLPGGACRRRAPRTRALILNNAERAFIRRSIGRVADCGNIPRVLRKLRVDGETITETRTTVLTACGLRWCAKCESSARRYRALRAEGPWSQMVTLTLDPALVSIRRAWSMMSRWVGRLIRWMQRQAEKRSGGPVVTNALSRQLRAEWSVGMIDRLRAIPHVLYAWALEPHGSGYPHCHLAVSCRWLDYGAVRKKWRAITRNRRSCPEHTVLADASATNRYLTKYITKASLPPDLCALTRRKRCFWSAMPLRWSPPKGCTTLATDTAASATSTLNSAASYSPHSGWRPTLPPSPSFVVQERAWHSAAVNRTEYASADVAPPANWEGTPLEWQTMLSVARAKRDGYWGWRWWHVTGQWMDAALRREVIHLAAFAFRHGVTLRHQLRRWRPRAPLPPLLQPAGRALAWAWAVQRAQT